MKKPLSPMRTTFTKAFLLVSGLLISTLVSAQIIIEAEDYTAMSGVEVENTTDDGGGQNVGWTDNNDWMEYDVIVPFSGDYEITSRFASESGGGSFQFEVDGSVLTTLSFGSTGGWQNWQSTTSDKVTLTKGVFKLKVNITSGGFNLNWLQLHLVNPIDTDAPDAPKIISSSSEVRSVSMTWSAVKDPTTAVSGYRILNNSKNVAFTTDTSFTLKRLDVNTSFNFSIIAYDVAGNQSMASTLSLSTKEPDWDLVWSDEFDGTNIDRNKWYFETGNHGWGNGEAQNYTDGDNAFIEDGNLVIEARKENSNGSDFSSTRMNNTAAFDFKYGRIEVKAKLPSTGGTWPAIWTLPREWSYGTWPLCGEIDIMEHTGNNLNHVFGTIHTGAYNHSIGTQKGGGKNFSDVVNTYHTYVLEWYPDRLDWYYDGELVFTFENENKTFEEWPFDIPHYLKLNIAIGGGLGGNIDYNGVWPQQMVVDYVRVYDLGFGKNDNIAPSTPTNLTATADGVDVQLNWDISTDNRYVKNYYIYQDDVLIDSVSRNAFLVRFLDPNTEYNFSVVAQDFGNNSSAKATTSVTTEEITGVVIPAKIEAEDFDFMEGMETEPCSDEGGGLNMAYIGENDYLAYYIDVKEAGTYYLAARVAAMTNQISFALDNENNIELTTIRAAATGGWQNWETKVSEEFQLEAGIQTVIIRSTGRSYNINWIAITDDPNEYSSIKSIENNSSFRIYPNPASDEAIVIKSAKNVDSFLLSIFTTDGKLVYKKKLNGQKGSLGLANLNLDSGVYSFRIESNNKTEWHQVVIE